MSTFGQRIRSLRESKRINQKEFAEILHISNSTLSQYESDTRVPSDEIKIKIADYFNVSIDYLLGQQVTRQTQSKKGIKIPVLGQVEAGLPIEAVENIIDEEEIDEELARTGEFFGLQVHGHSMEPRFSPGDVVIVRKQPDVENGQIAIVLVNGDEATLKKVTKHRDGISLVPLNPAFETMFYSNADIFELPVTIIGRVVELRAKF